MRDFSPNQHLLGSAFLQWKQGLAWFDRQLATLKPLRALEAKFANAVFTLKPGVVAGDNADTRAWSTLRALPRQLANRRAPPWITDCPHQLLTEMPSCEAEHTAATTNPAT
jgi:hypothetical protein